MKEWVGGLRAGRTIANLPRQIPMPQGTDSINLPKLSTLTQVAPQQADGAPVASRDITSTSVQANVKTLAGQEDVSLQLLEQSPGDLMDGVIMEDLMADYNRLVGRQVAYGSGANTSSLNAGQILGLYGGGATPNWAGTSNIATTATITGVGFLPIVGAMWSNIANQRFDVENVHGVFNPRRLAWWMTSLDGASGTVGRPVVGAETYGPYNVQGLLEGGAAAEGLVASSMGGRVGLYAEPNIPGGVTTSGGDTAIGDNGSGVPLAGQTHDAGVMAKWDDVWLFESDLRTRVLYEVLSGVLMARFQVYSYVAMLVRYGQSLAIAYGTSFAAPQSAFDSGVTF